MQNKFLLTRGFAAVNFWHLVMAFMGAFLMSVHAEPINPDMESSMEAAQTLSSPDMPDDQFHWVLRPLTRQQLEHKAQAWMTLLARNISDIAELEIQIKRLNMHIKKAEALADVAHDAKETVQEVSETESGDSKQQQARGRDGVSPRNHNF